eukprot:365296-Chlamydomonas_euryale.AAC.11
MSSSLYSSSSSSPLGLKQAGLDPPARHASSSVAPIPHLSGGWAEVLRVVQAKESAATFATALRLPLVRHTLPYGMHARHKHTQIGSLLKLSHRWLLELVSQPGESLLPTFPMMTMCLMLWTDLCTAIHSMQSSCVSHIVC